MLIHPGTQELIVRETTLGSGTTVRQGSIQSDALLASLYVESVSSGDLSITVYTLTYEGKEVELFSFPVIVTGTTQLVLKKSGSSLGRFLVRATYTGICTYEIYVRAIEGSGESSTRLLGSGSLRTSQIDVPTSPTILIPASLTDRQGLVIKNWSTVGDLYISEDSAKLPAQAWGLRPSDALAMDIAAGVTIYGLASAGILDVRIAEVGS